jgi:ribosome recycling factor
MHHEILDDLNRRMDKTVEVFEHELASVRTGRASVALLDSVRVDYYGQLMPLNQVATLKTPDASTITVQPWERNLLPAVDRAIRAADLDLNPASDGTMLRIPIPPLSQERRQQLARSISRMAEEHKNALRQVRRDANQRAKKLVKNKELSEDLEHDLEAAVQKATDTHVKRLAEIASRKEASILSV